MLDRILKVNSRSDRHGAGSRPGSKHSRRQPLVEVLESRQLLTASLAPITNFTVPAGLGYQLPLNGSGNTTPNSYQTYEVTYDNNPKITATIAQGPFWTLNVQHNASSQPGDISFAGKLTFQLFQDLTPNTVTQISKFTTDGWYNGKDFTRIANNFPGATDYIAQGGAANADGTGTTPYPNFDDEFVQQDTFTGTQQLAMANGGPNTNNTQFFVTTGTPTFLDFKHTVFGQLVSGSDILADMTKVSVQPNTTNTALNGENSLPVSPIVINLAQLTTTSLNGVIHINTTSATPGQTATITVTATDPTDNTTATRSFTVTTAGNTDAVHLIDNDVLVVTPPPRTDRVPDKIEVSQQANPTTGAQNIVVTVNGVPDLIQPLATSLLQIIVFGGKASTDIQVDPNVLKTIPVTLDGGHGGHNVIQAGAGPTREHGWFGHTLLIGGTGSNELIGRKGFVLFKPTPTTNRIYSGNIKPRFKHRTVPPSGTYYRYVNGRLVPVLTT